MKRKIAALTTSRADYSHLYWPWHDLAAHPDVDLQLIVIGSHLSRNLEARFRKSRRTGSALMRASSAC